MAAILRVTRRCLIDDLTDEELGRSVEELAESHAVVRAFVERRSQSPEGQETIQGLTSKIVAYSLHSGADRGITWHQKKAGAVWLLAVRFHRSGQADDAYVYFAQLDASGKLLPTSEDLRDLITSQRMTFARALLEHVPPLREAARENPGVIQQGVLADRVPVRVALEGGDPSMVTVAISQTLRPGETQVPPGWQLAIAAAFLPSTTPPEALSFASDIAGEPLREDEVAYCDFVEGEIEGDDEYETE